MKALLINELRGLLTPWAVTVALVLVGAFSRDTVLGELAPLAFLLGSFVLGGLAFGQEYLNGTMPLLLTQPVTRRQIYMAKMAVLALALGSLGAISYWTVLADLSARELPAPVERVMAFLFLTPLLAGPAMTLATRSAIAGTVLAGAVPGTVTAAAGVIGVYTFGWDQDAAIVHFQTTVFWRVVAVYWGLCAVWSWWAFMRLEAADGGSVDFNPFAWFRSRAGRVDARRVHPIAALVAKELHIQQLVFVIAAGYVLVATLFLLGASPDDRTIRILIPVTFLYAATLPILIGALASAEERQFGTLESQLLLPIPSARQWIVKAAVVLGLSVLLAVGLPFIVLLPLDEAHFAHVRADVEVWPLILLVLVVGSASLYVSTLARSGIRAMVLAVPVLFAGLVILQWSAWVVIRLNGSRYFDMAPRTGDVVMPIVALLLVSIFLTLGHQNHKTSDISFTRALRQLPFVAAFVAFASCVLQIL